MALVFSVSTVRQLMTPHPALIGPGATLEEAAQRMESAGCGALPVGTEEDLQGMITDRDIVVRAIAKGKNPAEEKVGDCMTRQVFFCGEDDSLEEASEKMHRNKVSRLVVKNKDGKVTGILSFGTVFRNDAKPEELADIIRHAAGPVSVSG